MKYYYHSQQGTVYEHYLITDDNDLPYRLWVNRKFSTQIKSNWYDWKGIHLRTYHKRPTCIEITKEEFEKRLFMALL